MLNGVLAPLAEFIFTDRILKSNSLLVLLCEQQIIHTKIIKQFKEFVEIYITILCETISLFCILGCAVNIRLVMVFLIFVCSFNDQRVDIRLILVCGVGI